MNNLSGPIALDNLMNTFTNTTESMGVSRVFTRGNDEDYYKAVQTQYEEMQNQINDIQRQNTINELEPYTNDELFKSSFQESEDARKRAYATIYESLNAEKEDRVGNPFDMARPLDANVKIELDKKINSMIKQLVNYKRNVKQPLSTLVNLAEEFYNFASYYQQYARNIEVDKGYKIIFDTRIIDLRNGFKSVKEKLAFEGTDLYYVNLMTKVDDMLNEILNKGYLSQGDLLSTQSKSVPSEPMQLFNTDNVPTDPLDEYEKKKESDKIRRFEEQQAQLQKIGSNISNLNKSMSQLNTDSRDSSKPVSVIMGELDRINKELSEAIAFDPTSEHVSVLKKDQLDLFIKLGQFGINAKQIEIERKIFDNKVKWYVYQDAMKKDSEKLNEYEKKIVAEIGENPTQWSIDNIDNLEKKKEEEEEKDIEDEKEGDRKKKEEEESKDLFEMTNEQYKTEWVTYIRDMFGQSPSAMYALVRALFSEGNPDEKLNNKQFSETHVAKLLRDVLPIEDAEQRNVKELAKSKPLLSGLNDLIDVLSERINPRGKETERLLYEIFFNRTVVFAILENANKLKLPYDPLDENAIVNLMSRIENDYVKLAFDAPLFDYDFDVKENYLNKTVEELVASIKETDGKILKVFKDVKSNEQYMTEEEQEYLKKFKEDMKTLKTQTKDAKADRNVKDLNAISAEYQSSLKDITALYDEIKKRLISGGEDIDLNDLLKNTGGRATYNIAEKVNALRKLKLSIDKSLEYVKDNSDKVEEETMRNIDEEYEKIEKEIDPYTAEGSTPPKKHAGINIAIENIKEPYKKFKDNIAEANKQIVDAKEAIAKKQAEKAKKQAEKAKKQAEKAKKQAEKAKNESSGEAESKTDKSSGESESKTDKSSGESEINADEYTEKDYKRDRAVVGKMFEKLNLLNDIVKRGQSTLPAKKPTKAKALTNYEKNKEAIAIVENFASKLSDVPVKTFAKTFSAELNAMLFNESILKLKNTFMTSKNNAEQLDAFKQIGDDYNAFRDRYKDVTGKDVTGNDYLPPFESFV